MYVYTNIEYPVCCDDRANSNKDMLASYASDNFSRSSASLMMIPAQQQIILIGKIQSQTSFLCAWAANKSCERRKEEILTAPSVNGQHYFLGGSTTAVILGDVAEKMLDMTTKDIFDTACDRKGTDLCTKYWREKQKVSQGPRNK
ncbi:uncharacterized protein LOC142181643 [Nicotiana tabacum]|uniref:Uncharacterized protein LOC142181643 n=18 Tax=Nicotiana tabacum TaxID=4097 RepID=A0AC58UNH0_TOBAC